MLGLCDVRSFSLSFTSSETSQRLSEEVVDHGDRPRARFGGEVARTFEEDSLVLRTARRAGRIHVSSARTKTTLRRSGGRLLDRPESVVVMMSTGRSRSSRGSLHASPGSAPSRSRPAKDVTPGQCPWAFARSHRLRDNLRALRVTVTLYRRHQSRGQKRSKRHRDMGDRRALQSAVRGRMEAAATAAQR